MSPSLSLSIYIYIYILEQLEGPVRLAAAVRELHQDGEREVARDHARLLHVYVVSSIYNIYIILLYIYICIHYTYMYNVCIYVRLLHVGEDRHAAVEQAVARAAVEERVVGDLVRQELLAALHVLIIISIIIIMHKCKYNEYGTK